MPLDVLRSKLRHVGLSDKQVSEVDEDDEVARNVPVRMVELSGNLKPSKRVIVGFICDMPPLSPNAMVDPLIEHENIDDIDHAELRR
ncbi:hypothetical protein PHMEG_0006307 [Phytophthora megakarya]|uniref:Uncharacterized protein n=1 Tax=Phytophthora megakarya TaxID=4795 RepID=A0A225WP54_9STRA|nr:hypothetical protein PHMEG_0006307 [Phytophthora megakarya]